MSDIVFHFTAGLIFSVFGTACWFIVLRPLGDSTAAKWGAVIGGGAMLFASVFFIDPPLAYGMGVGSLIGTLGCLYVLLKRTRRV